MAFYYLLPLLYSGIKFYWVGELLGCVSDFNVLYF